MSHRIGLIHTVPGLIPVLEPLIRKDLPGWDFFNLVDESLLKDTIRLGRLTPETQRRFAGHVWSVIDAGANAVLVTCSSIGPAVDATIPFSPVPLLRIDQGMAEEAVRRGPRIGVVATLSTTLIPTRDLIARTAAAKSAEAAISENLVHGAFQVLASGDQSRHDELVREAIVNLADKVDVIVLAQASMARVLAQQELSEVTIPILSSPELGIRKAKCILSSFSA